jgi:hypothetical protein
MPANDPTELPADPALAATLAAVTSMEQTLSVARALVEAGRRIELAGLESEAARLCAAVACLPEGSAARLRPPLQALTGELDRLAGALRAA